MKRFRKFARKSIPYLLWATAGLFTFEAYGNYRLFNSFENHARDELATISHAENEYYKTHQKVKPGVFGAEPAVELKHSRGQLIMPASLYFASLSIDRQKEIAYYSHAKYNPFTIPYLTAYAKWHRELPLPFPLSQSFLERIGNSDVREVKLPK